MLMDIETYRPSADCFVCIWLIDISGPKLGWAPTKEKATNCRLLSLFDAFLRGRQKATERI